MVTTKKQKLAKNSSAAMHSSRHRIRSSRIAKSQDTSRKIHRRSRHTILAVIVLAMMSVILTILFTTLSTPERVITHQVEAISTDYYENYFYDQIGSNATSNTSIPEIMEKYLTRGFAKITLNQLLHFDNGRHSGAASTLSTYCDLENTYIKIYPLEPFGRQDYRIDYHYSCEF